MKEVSLSGIVIASIIELCCLGAATRSWSNAGARKAASAGNLDRLSGIVFPLIVPAIYLAAILFGAIHWLPALFAAFGSGFSQALLQNILRSGMPTPGDNQSLDHSTSSRWFELAPVLNALAWLTPVLFVVPRFEPYALLFLGAYQTLAATWAIDVYQTAMERFPDNTNGKQRDSVFAGVYALIAAVIANSLLILCSVYGRSDHTNPRWAVWGLLLIAGLTGVLSRRIQKNRALLLSMWVAATVCLATAGILLIHSIGLTWQRTLVAVILALAISLPFADSFVSNVFLLRLQVPTPLWFVSSFLVAACFGLALTAIVLGYRTGFMGLNELAISMTFALAAYLAIIAAGCSAADLKPLQTPLPIPATHYTPNSAFFNVSHDLILSTGVFIAGPILVSVLGVWPDVTFVVSVAIVVFWFAIGNLWHGAPANRRASANGDVEGWNSVQLIRERLSDDDHEVFAAWLRSLKEAFRRRALRQMITLGVTLPYMVVLIVANR